MADSLDALLNPGIARHGRRAGSITSVPTSSSSSYDSSPSLGRKPSLGMGLPSSMSMGMGINSGPSSGSSSFNPSPVLSRTTSRPNSKGPTIGDLDTTPSFASSISGLGSTLPVADREGSAGRRASALTGRRASTNPSLTASLTSPLSDQPEPNNNISGSSSFSPSVSIPSRRSISSREAASAATAAPLPAAPSVIAPAASAEPVTYRSSLYSTTKDNKENNSAQVNPPSQPNVNDTPEYTPSTGKRWGSLTSRMQPAEDGSKNGKGLAPIDAPSSDEPSTTVGPDGKRAAPLFGCPDCGRQFKRQALIVHQRSCKKVQSKRETFNTAEKRLQDVLEQDKQLASTTPAFDKDRYQEDAAAKTADKKQTKKEKEPRGSIKEKILAAQKAKETSTTITVPDERPLDLDIPASSSFSTTKASPSSSSTAATTAAEKAAEAEKKASWRAESLKLREEMKNAKKMYNGGAGSMGIDISRMMPKM